MEIASLALIFCELHRAKLFYSHIKRHIKQPANLSFIVLLFIIFNTKINCFFIIIIQSGIQLSDMLPPLTIPGDKDENKTSSGQQSEYHQDYKQKM